MLRRSLFRLNTAATGTECILSVSNYVATINMTRQPRKNALGRVMLNELQHAVRSCHKNPSVRCVVLTSSVDGVFCAGADLKERKEMSPDEARAFVDQLRQTFCEIEDLSVPCIAAVEGKALGGGLELALAADLRVAGAKAGFGVPETGLAIIPGAGGTQRLTKTIGLPRAKLLAFTAKPVPTSVALQYGLVDLALDEGKAEAGAMLLALQIADNGPIAVSAAKQAINRGFYASSRDEGMAIERECYDLVLGSKDRLEGLKAFAEKRKPEYRGE